MLKKIIIIFIFLIPVVFVVAAGIERVSVNEDQVQGNGVSTSGQQALSRDGRYVAFVSNSSNLVEDDENGQYDIFVYDRDTDTVERVSVSSLGDEGNGSSSFAPAISSDGRYVAFESTSDNLVDNDNNFLADAFVYDRDTDTVERVSVSSLGDEGDGSSYGVSLSADGRYVAFGSDATNFVEDDTNGSTDIFVHDRQTGETERVSVSSADEEGNGVSEFNLISSDGRYVLFESSSSNLVAGDTNGVNDVFVRDRESGETTRVSVDTSGNQLALGGLIGSISSDGESIVFLSNDSSVVPGDTNGITDVFLYNQFTGKVERVNLDESGNQAFGGTSLNLSISSDGRYVAFVSTSTNLVANDTNNAPDLFLKDRETGSIRRITISNSGEQSNGTTLAYAGFSLEDTDARFVVFSSNATNLTSETSNGNFQVFLYDSSLTTIEEVSNPGTITGFIFPHIELKNDLKETSSRVVPLRVFAPYTIMYFELSNTSDFSQKETFIRKHTRNAISWDVCGGFIDCVAGTKKIYARFYNKQGTRFEDEVSVEYGGPGCPVFKHYLKRGWRNDTEEVKKVQQFLNEELGTSIAVDGIFGSETESSVRVFQDTHPDNILMPWKNLRSSTGFWYITTTAFANFLAGC